jgi:hypothetical protein
MQSSLLSVYAVSPLRHVWLSTLALWIAPAPMAFLYWTFYLLSIYASTRLMLCLLFSVPLSKTALSSLAGGSRSVCLSP